MSKQRNYKARNVNESIISKGIPPLDLTRAFIGRTPSDKFSRSYSKSVGLTNADLAKQLSARHQKGNASALAPYLYDANRRGMPVPARVEAEYRVPGEDYVSELSRLSSNPASKYINAFLLASGATTGYAVLDLAQEQLSKRSPSFARGFQTIEDSAGKAVGKFLKGKKGRVIESLTAKPISEVLGGKSQKGSKLIGRVIGAGGSAPLAAAAAIPLMSSSVTGKLKGDDPKSMRHKVVSWVERNPAAPIAAAFAPMTGKAMYGGYKDLGASLAKRKEVGGSALKTVGKSLTRSGITLGKIGLGATVPIAYLSMRKHMQKARDAESDLIKTKLTKTGAAADSKDKGINYKRLAAISAAPGMIGVGVAGMGAGGAISSLSNVKASPDTMAQAKKLRGLQQAQSPAEFVKGYTGIGNSLMNSSLKYKGKEFSAEKVMESGRSGTLGSILKSIGISPGMYDSKSREHYRAFKSSPQAAFSQIMTESYPQANAFEDIANTYKGKRWKAIESLSAEGKNISPLSIVRRTSSDYAKEMGLSPEQAKAVEKAVLRTERGAYNANRKAYKVYNSKISRAIKSKDVSALSRLDALKDRLFARSGLGKSTSDRVYSGIVSGKHDIVGEMASRKLQQAYSPHVKHGYGKIHGMLKTVKNINRGGKILLGGGAALALGGIALGAYGIRGSGQAKTASFMLTQKTEDAKSDLIKTKPKNSKEDEGLK